jgi:hypothetical protein
VANRILSQRVATLHNQLVVVVTDVGLPVSVGRLKLVRGNPDAPTVDRIEVEFETQRLRCTLRIPPDKWPALIEHWDGATTRYVLPHCDGFWLDEREKSKRSVLTEFLRGNPSEPPTRPRRRRRRGET